MFCGAIETEQDLHREKEHRDRERECIQKALERVLNIQNLSVFIEREREREESYIGDFF